MYCAIMVLHQISRINLLKNKKTDKSNTKNNCQWELYKQHPKGEHLPSGLGLGLSKPPSCISSKEKDTLCTCMRNTMTTTLHNRRASHTQVGLEYEETAPKP